MNFFRTAEPPSTDRRDLYECLGVSSTATPEDIKKAFRAASLKYHPDKNPNNPEALAKFQAVSEAYSILSDERKRQSYDFYNQSHPPQQEDLFAQFFGGMSPRAGGGGVFVGGMPPAMFMGGGGGGSRRAPTIEINEDDLAELFGAFFNNSAPQPQQQMRNITRSTTRMPPPEPLVAELEVTMYDVYIGAQIPLQIERWVLNSRTRMRTPERETLYVQIYKGIDDGEIITIPEKGHVVGEDSRGDVKVTIRVTNTTDFKRKGLDLLFGKRITLKEALCGDFEFELKLLDGNSCTIKNKRGSIIEPNFRKTYPNMGLTRGEQTGNMIICFIVEFPTRLTDEQMDRLREIL